MPYSIFFCYRAQRGAVLITSLVLLVILTLLGLSTMTTSSLEERMAANSQSVSRAFHVADAGLTVAFDDVASLSTTDTTTRNINNIGGYNANVTYTSEFRQLVPLGRESDAALIWGSDYGKYHFELGSVGTIGGANAIAEAELVGGIVQIGPVAD